MLTEEEARQKWCPYGMAYQADGAPVAFNRTADFKLDEIPPPPEVCNCIGSDCMAWRFKPQEWKHGTAIYGEWIDTQETDGFGRTGEKLPTVGYCGLAGSP